MEELVGLDDWLLPRLAGVGGPKMSSSKPLKAFAGLAGLAGAAAVGVTAGLAEETERRADACAEAGVGGPKMSSSSELAA